MANKFFVHIEPKEQYFNYAGNFVSENVLGNIDAQVSYTGVSGAAQVVESSNAPEDYHELENTLSGFDAFYFQADEPLLLSVWVNGLPVWEFSTKLFFQFVDSIGNVVFKVRNIKGFPVNIFYNYYGA